MGGRKKVYTIENRDIDATAINRDSAVFAKVFNKLLEEKGITATQIQTDLQISAGSISAYRNGTKQPTLSNIIAIANYLEVDCNYLMTGIRSRNDTASRATGLSDIAIQKLHQLKLSNRMEWGMDVLNCLIESEDFEVMLGFLVQCATQENHTFDYSCYRINTKDIAETKAVSTFQEIMHEIESKFIDKKSSDDRVLYRLVYSMYNKGKLTKEQCIKTIREFDRGNYNYDPLAGQGNNSEVQA